MQAVQQGGNDVQKFHSFRFILLAMLVLATTSCGYRGRDTRRAETPLEPGWPQPNRAFRQASLPVLQVSLPTIPDAEYVNDDEMCQTCHTTYGESMADNVHRGIHEGQSCEACHGPASRHLEARGQEPGLILNPKRMQPAEASELCLKCHEQNACAPGGQWRTSVHAHNRLTCISCHTAHYNVPAGTPITNEPNLAASQGPSATRLAS